MNTDSCDMVHVADDDAVLAGGPGCFHILLDLFAAALEARLGQEPLQATGLVRVQEFLSLVLGAIPVQPAA